MISAAAITATATAAAIVTAGDTAAEGRDDTLVHNVGAVTAYLGGADVDTTDGYPLAAGEVVGLHLLSGDDLYAVTAAETTTELRVLHTRA